MIGVFVQVNEESRYATHRPVGYVIQENGCWDWVGCRNDRGYGLYRTREHGGSAHRWMYEQAYGPVPDGMELDHFACSNRACVNPSHLRPVTHRENCLRGNTVAARHRAKSHCPQGHALAGDNLLAAEARRGARGCRACKREQSRERTALRSTFTGYGGERNPSAKLTEAQAREIRRRYANGERQVALALEFGVTQSAVSLIVRGLTWKEEE